MAFAPARVDAVMLEARAIQLFERPRSGDAKREAAAAAGPLLEIDVPDGGLTPAAVRGACARALVPGVAPAAVVVRPPFVSIAARALAESPVRVAAALLLGNDPAAALAAGAQEVEVPLDAGALLAGRPDDVRGQIAAAKRACGNATLKVVIGAREFGSWAAVRRAAGLALAAGGDFLKTAGDTEPATLPALTLLLCEVLREEARRAGRVAGLALSGRALTADARAGFVSIARETLGSAWLRPEVFRIGAGPPQ